MNRFFVVHLVVRAKYGKILKISRYISILQEDEFRTQSLFKHDLYQKPILKIPWPYLSKAMITSKDKFYDELANFLFDSEKSVISHTSFFILIPIDFNKRKK